MDIYFERIKPLFDESGMTVKEIAAAIGCSYRDIYHWNKDGLKSYTKYLYEIAEVFNVNVEYLRGETDIKENPAPTNGNGTDDAILRFLHSLPIEKLVGILTLVDAPKELIAALNLEERKE